MISVVIPTKDDPEIFDAIDSVLNQSYDNFEIIIVDASDGALQESLESRCESKDIQYLHQPDYEHAPNLNGARNLGIEHSEGEIIALMDGDCIADQEWLENLTDYFENHDIVECNVSYASDREKNCPMDRVVENDGLEYRFLGAGLAFRKEVWRTSEFDEDLEFHDDTAFGLVALQNNYSYTYGARAEINHHAGRFSIKSFMTERLRFQDEAKFFDKYGDLERAENEVENLGPVLHPKEFAMLGATVFALGLGLYNVVISGAMIAGIMAATTAVYYRREDDKRELDFCPLDLIKLFFLVLITFIFVKRLAIWSGAVKDRVPVI